MKFSKSVTKEIREVLTGLLKTYEKSTPMSTEERRQLHKWVSKGNSPYSNECHIHDGDGFVLDYVAALREFKEMAADILNSPEPFESNEKWQSEDLPF